MCIFWTVCFPVIYRLKYKSLLEKNVKRRGWMQGIWFDAHWILRVDEVSGFICASCSVFYWSHCRLLMFSLSESSLQTAASRSLRRLHRNTGRSKAAFPCSVFQFHPVGHRCCLTKHMRCDSGKDHWLMVRMWHAWAGGGRAAGAVAMEPCQK